MPRWRADTQELLYLTLENRLMAVDVKAGSTFSMGMRRELFQLPAPVVGGGWASMPDAQRFLFPLPGEVARNAITVLTNWTATVAR